MAFGVWAWMVWQGAAWSATFTVTDAGDSHDARRGDRVCADSAGLCTLRAAVEEAAAVSGADIVRVPAGDVVLSLGAVVISQDLTVEGDGPDASLVFGTGDRVFDHTSGAFVVRDLGLADGTADHGGCVRSVPSASAASLEMSDVRFASCAAVTGGGALYVSGATVQVLGGYVDRPMAVTLDRVSFDDNRSTNGAGALQLDGNYHAPGTTQALSDLSFLGNEGAVGALLVRYSNVWIAGGEVRDNLAGTDAVLRVADGTLSWGDVTITGNVAPYLLSAGGPSADYGWLGLSGARVRLNSVSRGLASTDMWASIDLTSSVIRRNEVAAGGVLIAGGVHVRDSTIMYNHFLGSGTIVSVPTYAFYGWGVSASTIAGNRADGDLTVFDGSRTTVAGRVEHVTAIDNLADADADGAGTGRGYVGASPVTLSASVFARNAPVLGECVGLYTPAAPNFLSRVDRTACTASAPADVWGALARGRDPGLSGPFLDGDGQGVYTPVAGSPLIDAAVGSPATTDQLGHRRPKDGDRDGVAVSDIGAIERPAR